MPSISLCMIVRNEEKSLGRCLSSVAQAVDEIIIIDTGSTDRTIEIARSYTNRIESFEWIDDFAAARNYAFSHATMDYILWLDADDILTPLDLRALLALKRTLASNVDSVSMYYDLAFDEYGKVTSRLRRNRLVKRERNYRWIGAVHEYLEVFGNIMPSDIAVTHQPDEQDSDSNRNLSIYEKRLARGERFSPRDLYYYANELKDHGRYEAAIRYYEQFLGTGKGWIEDNVAACAKLADCYSELEESRLMVDSLLRSFYYDHPRPEFCCRLGFYFLQQNEPKTAAYWYRLAAEADKPEQDWGFASMTCTTWLPHLQLCVCYDRLGKYDEANHHNELAARYRPEDPRIISNREYLQNRISRKGEGGVLLG
ncbi:tetratricopeptide repeat-containing glycosyltransferase family 2 protein [Paenibacillus radicis (ex Gao et al. 2016)]|uniref:Beta 1,4 glucosyltransferase n=1 Tax=Paenibacillus radicis (ex Gao et al. 2016) TaxID=1737354 RepID=A0A917HRQ9_9BACL|nr:glycosyltransferase family 2 protein [Paenibacillus radicis (ex Gao et al. 2016)]GGG87267.1 beta 1,4 glucosyltransferase [Paenibacillus radicis (ex Gao et al. 2016)]